MPFAQLELREKGGSRKYIHYDSTFFFFRVSHIAIEINCYFCYFLKNMFYKVMILHFSCIWKVFMKYINTGVQKFSQKLNQTDEISREGALEINQNQVKTRGDNQRITAPWNTLKLCFFFFFKMALCAFQIKSSINHLLSLKTLNPFFESVLLQVA